jgi:hypothetical protein
MSTPADVTVNPLQKNGVPPPAPEAHPAPSSTPAPPSVPAPSPAPSVVVAAGDKNAVVQCLACAADLDRAHRGVVCGNGHNMCPGPCTENFVNAVMGEPLDNIPVHCPTCKAPILSSTFERHLSQDQLNTYLSVVAMKTVNADEEVHHCAFCPYFEIWTKSSRGGLFLHCRGCTRKTCVVCNGEMVPPERGGFSDSNWRAGAGASTTSYLYHMECGVLDVHLTAFNQALERGTGMACPGCGHYGRKDDACTHMRCPNCHIEFCYVCGIANELLDKGTPGGRIHSHNEEWHLKTARCPMYLTEIGQIDPRWSQTDDRLCVAFLSRLRTLTLLRKAVQDIVPRRSVVSFGYKAPLSARWLVTMPCRF